MHKNRETIDQQQAADILGKIVIHRLSGERLMINKIHGSIAICKSEIVTVITEKPYFATNTVVCKLENLMF